MFAIGLAGACGSTDPSPEIVVNDAAMGAGAPALLGASANEVFWRAGTTAVGGTSLDALPGDAEMLGSTTGKVTHAGDHVLLATADQIMTARIGHPAAKLIAATADTLAQGPVDDPLLAWSMGATVSYGLADSQKTATLPKVSTCDTLVVSPTSVFVAARTSGGERLVRIDRRSGVVATMTSASASAALFPGGVADGATYGGKLVGADASGALWLVTEAPSGRAIVVDVPDDGEATVLLPHLQNPSAVFATDDALYWQEGDALLSAPRAGGPATIAAHVENAGAVADGFVYYVDGNAILRAPLD